jgi:hypothetical protein
VIVYRQKYYKRFGATIIVIFALSFGNSFPNGSNQLPQTSTLSYGGEDIISKDRMQSKQS